MSKLLLIFALTALSACDSPPKAAPSTAPPPAAASALTPMAVVQRFRDVLRAEMVPAALFMIDDVNFGSPAADQVRLRIKRLAEEMARGTYDFKPVEQQVQDDCAAVIVRENPSRQGAAVFSAMYLVRRQGAWKLSPEPTNYAKFLALSGAQLTTFNVLERWFQLRKADLKVESRDAGR